MELNAFRLDVLAGKASQSMASARIVITIQGQCLVEHDAGPPALAASEFSRMVLVKHAVSSKGFPRIKRNV